MPANNASGNSVEHLAAHAAFLAAAGAAPNETSVREAFVGLAASAFAESGFARELALGAEYAVTFREGGLVRRGRVDSFIDNVLVEFKRDIRPKTDRYRHQLAGYIAGAWREDASFDRPYLGVLTDGLRWQVYASTPKDPDGSPDVENVQLALVDSWEASDAGEKTARDFADFINRLFFRRSLLNPTASNFARDFGTESPAFISVASRLQRTVQQLAGEPQMQTHKSAWAEDVRTSYGGGSAPAELFVRHTYLAVLTRLLVFAALEHKPLSEADADGVLDGTYFIGRRIGNFVEDDYFQWPLLASRGQLRPTWHALVEQLRGYDLAAVKEDVLKPLYEQLVDPATRHDLGEYYTPDWLAEEVVAAALEPWLARDEIPRVLDPACGSGSFIRATLRHLRTSSKSESAQTTLGELLTRVTGMDVNPMAVTVSKATYLLAVADLVREAEEVVHLPVFLCNSLSSQERADTSSLFGNESTLHVGLEERRREFRVPLDLVQCGPDFDQAIAEVVHTARSVARSSQPPAAAADALKARLADLTSRYLHGNLILDSLGEMTAHMVALIRDGLDTIYGFLLRNRYRSALLYRQVDLVLGNPPWLTIADITAPAYRELVLQRARETKLAGRTAGEQAHTELATLFLGQAFEQFLCPIDDAPSLPRVAFVMPRSVFAATHHRPLREGAYVSRFHISELWDLEDVSPLFNVPSCVVFATQEFPRPEQVKKGRVYRGRLGSRDPEPSVARESLERRDAEFALLRLGKRTAWAERDPQSQHPSVQPVSDYHARFRQGAVLYPQTLVGIRPIGALGRGPGDVAVETDPAVKSAAKVLAHVDLSGVVERSSLFSTAAAEHLLPYSLASELWTVVLPVLNDPGDSEFAVRNPDELRRAGRVGTADWFEEANALWISAQKKRALPLWDRLDHLGQLAAQGKRSRWLVLYTSAGSRPVAAVVDSQATPYPFVVRDQTYWASFYDPTEAHYVSAVLNSDAAADRIQAFMSRGLFGPRHIHKRVLDVPLKAFKSDNHIHVELAVLGQQLSEHAQQRVHVGGLRRSIARRAVRDSLPNGLLSRVEEYVEKLFTGMDR